MDMMLLDTNLDEVAVLDAYKSLIWTDRYAEKGDFELYTPANEETLSLVKMDFYLTSPESEHAMIVEDIRIDTDPENGDYITISGRSLESLLERRVIWGRKVVSGKPQNVIRTLINECIINPSIAARKISNFVFEASDDPAITGLPGMYAQYIGDNLYDIIVGICNDNNIGFKITLNDNKQFVFKLYAGVDRSYNQTKNSYVVFSPGFDNLITANYIETRTALKTIALVAGEGEGSERRFAESGSTKESGMNRRELYVDARDLSSDSGAEGGNALTDEEYGAQLIQRGRDKLTEHTDVSSFEGQAETRIMFRYGEDFFTGDIVQFADGYGHEAPTRIVEMITSDNEEGLSVYPTFKTLQDKEGA
jgi:hypothetical protein